MSWLVDTSGRRLGRTNSNQTLRICDKRNPMDKEDPEMYQDLVLCGKLLREVWDVRARKSPEEPNRTTVGVPGPLRQLLDSCLERRRTVGQTNLEEV